LEIGEMAQSSVKVGPPFDGNNLVLVVFDCLARLILAPRPKRANLPRAAFSRGAAFVVR
jgi:hypothetical protein